MSTTDLDEQVAALRKRIADAGTRRARAEAQAALAGERVAQAERALRDEFGVEPSQAARRIASLEADLAAEARRVEAALERAEASE